MTDVVMNVQTKATGTHQKDVNMGRLFEDLKKGMQEIIAHKEGKITLKSEFIEISEPPKEYSPKKIKNIRIKWNYSQGVFAKVLNMSLKTVQAWESGDRNPNHAALRLLEIVDMGIYHPLVSSTSARPRKSK